MFCLKNLACYLFYFIFFKTCNNNGRNIFHKATPLEAFHPWPSPKNNLYKKKLIVSQRSRFFPKTGNLKKSRRSANFTSAIEVFTAIKKNEIHLKENIKINFGTRAFESESKGFFLCVRKRLKQELEKLIVKVIAPSVDRQARNAQACFQQPNNLTNYLNSPNITFNNDIPRFFMISHQPDIRTQSRFFKTI